MAAFHPMTGRANVICAGFVRTQLVDNVCQIRRRTYANGFRIAAFFQQ
jgi:hypothetical protein